MCWSIVSRKKLIALFFFFWLGCSEKKLFREVYQSIFNGIIWNSQFKYLEFLNFKGIWIIKTYFRHHSKSSLAREKKPKRNFWSEKKFVGEIDEKINKGRRSFFTDFYLKEGNWWNAQIEKKCEKNASEKNSEYNDDIHTKNMKIEA